MRKVIRINVDGQVQWQVTKTETERWVAVCDPFGLSMEGKSLDDLYANINETIQLLFEDLFEDGELEKFLTARGWTAQPIVPKSDEKIAFEVPFELLVRSESDSSRAIH